ncbi:hypothetical protein FCH28_02010 [Streptomyces piniterrae]|uniref:Integral membrane protein n=1 Tax=Streptomyces piniterrae TaxID=2571125 RepID=A0A4U0NW69_9ACTN|nr:hypothetical protein [Streptomyces piniterrae]TJZ58953.1 hypothetical protein FCH28_02010 [Streptomyces piniterrae]
MTAGSVSRAVRAAIFAAVCVTTAALGHSLMSPRPVPWWALVAACGATGAMAWWPAGRERGGFVVTGSTVLTQLGLHFLFDLQTPHAPAPTPMDGMPGMNAHPGHATPGMFCAHALAALVCGVWLWRGEAAACRLGRSMVAVLFAPLLLVLTTLSWAGPKPSAGPSAGAVRVLRPRGVLLHHVVSRRGPPELAVCC